MFRATCAIKFPDDAYDVALLGIAWLSKVPADAHDARPWLFVSLHDCQLILLMLFSGVLQGLVVGEQKAADAHDARKSGFAVCL